MKTLSLCLAVIFLTAPALADLGEAENPNIIWKAQIVEQPVKIKDATESQTVIVTPEVELDYNQVYQSPYLDVSAYRHVSFFVKRVKALNDELDEKLVYQLDAYFSVENDLTSFKDFSKGETRLLQPGLQEAGNTLKAAGHPDEPSFIKTSTGETSTRILYSPVYCPFVRVELRNKTKGDKRRFRVSAYLTR